MYNLDALITTKTCKSLFMFTITKWK